MHPCRSGPFRLNLLNTTFQHLCNPAGMFTLISHQYWLQIHTPSFQNTPHTQISSALSTTFLSLAEPFMDAHRPSSAGVGLPLPQTSTQCVHQCLCECVCVRRLTWRLVLEPDTPHTIHTDVSLVHLFNLSFLSFLLFYFFDSPLPSTGSVTWDANGWNPLCWNIDAHDTESNLITVMMILW